MGGPNGGDGGKGGDVILEVDTNLNNLVHLRYSPHQFAKPGGHGKGAQKTGKNGRDILLKVPPGTSVFHLPTTDDDFERAADLERAEPVADLLTEGDSFILATGGRGGRGNQHFKSSTNQAPRRKEEGFAGTQGQFFLELKSIADVGLVGFPNAGKSSLLAALSSARPKIAPYPFTTLKPMIGVIDTPAQRRFTIADIPGLIEGAHAGVGLGHDFLRHIERCRILAIVLDMAGTDGRDPADDFRQLRKEISLYDEDLARRPYLIIANKMDAPGAADALLQCRDDWRVPVVPVSTTEKTGLEQLVALLEVELQTPAAEAPCPA